MWAFYPSGMVASIAQWSCYPNPYCMYMPHTFVLTVGCNSIRIKSTYSTCSWVSFIKLWLLATNHQDNPGQSACKLWCCTRSSNSKLWWALVLVMFSVMASSSFPNVPVTIGKDYGSFVEYMPTFLWIDALKYNWFMVYGVKVKKIQLLARLVLIMWNIAMSGKSPVHAYN